MGKKLAVIGAGPGGLFAAKEAAALGFSVTVLKKEKSGSKFFVPKVLWTCSNFYRRR